MALVYPIDYLQDIILTELSSLPLLNNNGIIIPNTLKYPLFNNENIVLENQDYIIPNNNSYNSSDVNPFHIRILTSETKTISRTNNFIPLSSDVPKSIEHIIRKEMITFTFCVFSYKPNPALLQSNSLFSDPTSAFYKSHSASNVIYDVYNALLSVYAKNQLEIGNVKIQNDNVAGIKNLSFLEGGQIQERFQFDIQTLCRYETKKFIDNYNKLDTTLITN